MDNINKNYRLFNPANGSVETFNQEIAPGEKNVFSFSTDGNNWTYKVDTEKNVLLINNVEEYIKTLEASMGSNDSLKFLAEKLKKMPKENNIVSIPVSDVKMDINFGLTLDMKENGKSHFYKINATGLHFRESAQKPFVRAENNYTFYGKTTMPENIIDLLKNNVINHKQAIGIELFNAISKTQDENVKLFDTQYTKEYGKKPQPLQMMSIGDNLYIPDGQSAFVCKTPPYFHYYKTEDGKYIVNILPENHPRAHDNISIAGLSKEDSENLIKFISNEQIEVPEPVMFEESREKDLIQSPKKPTIRSVTETINIRENNNNLVNTPENPTPEANISESTGIVPIQHDHNPPAPVEHNPTAPVEYNPTPTPEQEQPQPQQPENPQPEPPTPPVPPVQEQPEQAPETPEPPKPESPKPEKKEDDKKEVKEEKEEVKKPEKPKIKLLKPIVAIALWVASIFTLSPLVIAFALAITPVALKDVKETTSSLAKYLKEAADMKIPESDNSQNLKPELEQTKNQDQKQEEVKEIVETQQEENQEVKEEQQEASQEEVKEEGTNLMPLAEDSTEKQEEIETVEAEIVEEDKSLVKRTKQNEEYIEAEFEEIKDAEMIESNQPALEAPKDENVLDAEFEIVEEDSRDIDKGFYLESGNTTNSEFSEIQEDDGQLINNNDNEMTF